MNSQRSERAGRDDEMKKMKKQWADNHPEEQTKNAEEENLM